MEIKGYHIISLEANDIYEQELINGVKKGFMLPTNDDRKFFGLFNNVLDYSLDLIELEKCYPYKIDGEGRVVADSYGYGCIAYVGVVLQSVCEKLKGILKEKSKILSCDK